jgi:CubicO group peptidase (beta-lactamase class C family)
LRVNTTRQCKLPAVIVPHLETGDSAARSVSWFRGGRRLPHSKSWRVQAVLILFGLLLPGLGLSLLCADTPGQTASEHIEAAGGFDRAVLAQMDAAIEHVIAEHNMPGGVLWVEHGTNQYHKAFGKRALIPTPEPMTEDTVFDAASLTKVLATAPSLMLLWERGLIKLDEPVMTYVPEFGTRGKEAITVRHLLTHTSGLNSGLSRASNWSGYEKAIELACAERPTNPPGTIFRYSDINFIMLGEVVQRVSHAKLNQFAEREIYQPLKMVDTGYLPSPSKRHRIAPTEQVAGEVLRGTVHDPTAQRMGGVAGHAGVFTTTADVARFARMFLNEGQLDGVQILRPDTVRLMTSVQSPAQVAARRGLGWDIDSDYSRPRGNIFPLGSYGHTGFTGVCLWIDPFSASFWMLFTNRVHPDRSGNILPLQRTLATFSAQAITDFDFTHVPGALPPRQTNAPAFR